jgi:hypothetical protein
MQSLVLNRVAYTTRTAATGSIWGFFIWEFIKMTEIIYNVAMSAIIFTLLWAGVRLLSEIVNGPREYKIKPTVHFLIIIICANICLWIRVF